MQRAVLGISFRAIDQQFIDDMGEECGINEVGGIYVASVTDGGAASEAGIRKGDIITALDGVATLDSATFVEQIGKRRPGDKITIELRRGQKSMQLTATLQNKAGETSLLAKDSIDALKELGAKFRNAPAALCRELDIKGGIQVTSIERGGLMERCRVREGYIITHINDRVVTSIDDLDRITEKITSIDGIYPNGRASSYTIMQ